MTHADVGVRQASAAGSDLGAMPVWNLGDLYPSPTSAEFRRDLDRAAVDAKRIAETYNGKLGTLGKDCKRRSKNPSVKRPIRSVAPE
jgi:hypothetical protein